MNIEELSDMSTYDFQDFTPRANDIFFVWVSIHVIGS